MTNLPRATLVRGSIGPAPRQVPRRIVLRLLFGSGLAHIVWLFPVVGMLAALGIQLHRVTYRGSTMATITDVVDTGQSDSDDNETYRVSFELEDEAGAAHTGSFTTTRKLERGAQPLQYDPDNPSDARLPVGAAQRGLYTVFALVFGGIGLLAAIGVLRAGRAAVRLLRYGEPTTGRIIEKVPGEGDSPDTLTFEYTARGKTYRLAGVVSSPRLEDDAEEPMLYDVKHPANAVTLDNLPGHPQIRDDGSLTTNPGLGVHVLVLPGVFAIATLAWLALLLRS